MLVVLLVVVSMSTSEGDVVETVLEREVAGEYTTFKVYLYLLRVKEVSPREIYRELGLSSPSLVLHHLEKLEKVGLVSKDAFGNYHVVKRKFGILRFFVVTGKWLIPRTVFYMIFFLLTAVGSMFMLPSSMREPALILSVVGFVTNLVETVYFYRVLP